MKCLIVGGKGNLGSALSRMEGWHVTSLGRSDWADADSLFGSHVDLVIHAAGELNQSIQTNPSAFVESNVLALARTLENMKAHGVKRIFYISSCAVYGASSSTAEDVPLNPLSLNGQAKLLCEKILRDYCSKNGVKWTVFRPFNIFGGMDRFSVLYHLNKCLLDDTPFHLNNDGRAQRDFVHVDDVAEVLFKLARREDLPSVINIGSGQATKIADVVERFASYNPELKLSNGRCEEVEYSRADTSRLNSLVNIRFASIFDSIVSV